MGCCARLMCIVVGTRTSFSCSCLRECSRELTARLKAMYEIFWLTFDQRHAICQPKSDVYEHAHTGEEKSRKTIPAHMHRNIRKNMQMGIRCRYVTSLACMHAYTNTQNPITKFKRTRAHTHNHIQICAYQRTKTSLSLCFYTYTRTHARTHTYEQISKGIVTQMQIIHMDTNTYHASLRAYTPTSTHTSIHYGPTWINIYVRVYACIQLSYIGKNTNILYLILKLMCLYLH